MAETAASWDDTVRRVDFDRYLSSLFAPAGLRSELNVLYAFNHEVAKTAETVSQPIAGEIRLQWWRDRIAELYRGVAVEHPVVEALGSVITARNLPRDLFDELIDAREHDLEEAPFATIEDFEAYADATSGGVMRLAARILGAGDTLDAPSRDLGVAYAIAGLCRSVPYHATRRRLMLPADRLIASGVSVEEVFAGMAGQRLRPLLDDMAARALGHLAGQRGRRIARNGLPALLPVAVAPLYLRALTRPGFDVFRDSAEIGVHRRQLAMLGAMIRRRV
jgi:NADH dehydrogenase [ubiquinone] 1 alpha subcomplex assembly factor 6